MALGGSVLASPPRKRSMVVMIAVKRSGSISPTGSTSRASTAVILAGLNDRGDGQAGRAEPNDRMIAWPATILGAGDHRHPQEAAVLVVWSSSAKWSWPLVISAEPARLNTNRGLIWAFRRESGGPGQSSKAHSLPEQQGEHPRPARPGCGHSSRPVLSRQGRTGLFGVQR